MRASAAPSSTARPITALIVHGHTPVRERVADLRENRINLDTGAVFGGVLTCGVFEEDRIGLDDGLTTSRAPPGALRLSPGLQ